MKLKQTKSWKCDKIAKTKRNKIENIWKSLI